MLKFKSAQGLFRIISAMNHLCREAVNCWVLGVHSAWGGFQEEREAPQCQQSDNNNNNHAAHMFTWNAHIVEMRAVNVNYHFNLLFSAFSAESAQTVYVNDFVPMESVFKCIFLCLSRHTNRKQEDERQNNYLKLSENPNHFYLFYLCLTWGCRVFGHRSRFEACDWAWWSSGRRPSWSCGRTCRGSRSSRPCCCWGAEPSSCCWTLTFCRTRSERRRYRWCIPEYRQIKQRLTTVLLPTSEAERALCNTQDKSLCLSGKPCKQYCLQPALSPICSF